MNSNPGDDLSTVKNEKEEFSETKSPRHSDGILLQPGIPPLQALDEDDAHSSANASNNQIVLYEPEAANQDVVVSELSDYDAPLPKFATSTFSNRVLPSVGAFTVQCAICFKWRLIPTKEKYEEIRANIMEEPFICATARTWREGVSCDIPADINQDGSRLWAIDKPSIAQPPPGWQRLLRIRGEGSTRFADVYYVTPTGKRLRSMVEIDKYLHDHPEYVEAGVKISQFSFQIPKPLQENYVRKRPHRPMQQFDGANLLPMPRANEPVEANPLAWAGPLSDTNGQVQIGDPTASDLYESPISLAPSRKKQATRSPHKMYNNSVHSYEH